MISEQGEVKGNSIQGQRMRAAGARERHHPPVAPGGLHACYALAA